MDEVRNFSFSVKLPACEAFTNLLFHTQHSTCTPEDNVCIAFEFIACRYVLHVPTLLVVVMNIRSLYSAPYLLFHKFFSVLEQRYDDPVMHEYALDGCYEYTKQCGDDAADAFCQQNGYVEAFDYAQVLAEGEEKYSKD